MGQCSSIPTASALPGPERAKASAASLLLIQAAARRKLAADAVLNRKWRALRDARGLAAEPDSWSCPRSRSSKLRSDPAQRVVVGFSSVETAQERITWAVGDPASRKRLDRSFLFWY